MPDLASAQGDLPEPSVELVLLRVMAEAYVATMPRKKAQRFLRTVGEKLVSEEHFSTVVQFRPATQIAAARCARRDAVQLYRAWLPTFLARLNRD